MPQIDLTGGHITVGERLREIRKARGKTLETAGMEANISPKQLSKIERGTVDFGILALLRLCQIYNVPVDKLLDGIGPGRSKR